MFFGVFWIFPKKKPIVLFECSMFLVLENLENPKKTMCFFCNFPGFFIEKSKKHHDVFWIFLGVHRKISKTPIVFFWIFKVLAFGNS